MNLDLQILKYFNDLASSSTYWYHLFNSLGNIELIRGVPVFACLIYVAFSNFSAKTKSEVLLGLVGATICLVISLLCQTVFHSHLRPVFDPSLNINNVLKWDKTHWGNRLYSLPSDTATIFFCISTIVFLQNKKLGIACFFWNGVTIGISRVALGIHYPSDILAAFILSLVLISIITRIKPLQRWIGAMLIKYDPHFNLYNILVVLFCAEAYSLFPGFQIIYNFLLKS